jgi:hypothetical protein
MPTLVIAGIGKLYFDQDIGHRESAKTAKGWREETPLGNRKY